MILSPSLLSADFTHLAQTLKNLEKAGLHWIHLDVMDGSFVPNITFGQHVIKELRACAPTLYFDTHLMIEEPARYITDFAKAGANMLTIHAESTRHIQRTLAEIRNNGMEAGIAFNPATPLDGLEYILEDIDMVLLMSVNPGFGGQSFIPSTFEKLDDLQKILTKRKSKKSCHVQVDGGVCPKNAKALIESGVSVLVSGSSFFTKNAQSDIDFAKRHQDFQNAVK